MKSLACSFSVFRVRVEDSTLTVSLIKPNWKINVTSGPSIFRTNQPEKDLG